MSARAEELKESLQLEPHPEGGRYRRVYTSTSAFLHNGVSRPVVTAIQYLLSGDEISRWHCIDADEIWQHSEGDALELLLFDAIQGKLQRLCLGRSEAASENVTVVGVPAGCWQAARPLGAYALVTCTVAPGFDFAGFQLLDAAPEVARALNAIDPALLRHR
jgi:uncharacterized protein